jgi:adenylate cyclase
MSRVQKPWQSMIKTVLLTSLAVAIPIVGIRLLGGFEAMELSSYDDFMRQKPAEKKDDRITVVTISDDDIEKLQQFPVHDGTLAKALEILEKNEPSVIALDIARDVPHGTKEGREKLKNIMTKDEYIISGCLLSRADYSGSPPFPVKADEHTVGFGDVPFDSDKTVRRIIFRSSPIQPQTSYSPHTCNQTNPSVELDSLGYIAAHVYLRLNNLDPKLNVKNNIQFGQQSLERIDSRFGGYANAETGDYQMMLNYRGMKDVANEVSISDILKQNVDVNLIRGRIIFIGNTSKVSKDFVPTPYGLLDGVFVHAQSASQILSAVLDKRKLINSWHEFGEMLWILGWSLSIGVVAFYSRRMSVFLLVLGGSVILIWWACLFLFTSQALWVPLIPTLFAAMLSAIGVRFLELADRNGYTQAIYEQFKLDWSRQSARQNSRSDYLADLVQRAQAARQGRAVAPLLGSPIDDTVLSSTTPEVQSLYQQLAAQARQEVAQEQEESIRQAKLTAKMMINQTRIQTLLDRASQTRTKLIPITTKVQSSPIYYDDIKIKETDHE